MSEVLICNMALSYIGDRANVQSITPTDGSAQSRYCADFYPVARDLVLESHYWSFAATRRGVELTAITPPDPWTYAFAVPSNALRVYRLLADGETDEHNTQPYELAVYDDGGTPVHLIYANVDAGDVVYTRQITETHLFPQRVQTAIAYKLAGMLAGPLTKNGKLVETMERMFEAQLARAKEQDGAQRNSSTWQDFTPTWISDR